MKRIIFLLYLILVTTVALEAQPRLILDKQTIDVGQVQWKEPIKVKYTLTNSGNSPLILKRVTTSCGCTVAQWTQNPIESQGEGTVKVEFDAEMLGTFHKSVAIHSNSGSSLVYLYLKGEVVKKVTDFSRTHPYNFNDILIDQNELVFSTVEQGKKQALVLKVANQRDAPYRPILMHLPSFIEANSNPEVLQKGEKGIITLTLDPDELAGYGIYKTPIYLSRFSGDKVGRDNEIPLKVLFIPVNTNQNKVPQLRFSTTQLDFSTELTRKNKATQVIELTNQGSADLIIHRVQLFHPSIKIQLNKTVLKPGQRGKLKVTIELNRIDDVFEEEQQIVLITNDPVHPKGVITVKP